MLTSQQRQYLKQQAHKLNPVVMIGNKGLTDNVLEEIDQALRAHELIKVRVNLKEREERQQVVSQITETVAAEKVQVIGHILILWRQNPDKPRIQLPR